MGVGARAGTGERASGIMCAYMCVPPRISTPAPAPLRPNTHLVQRHKLFHRLDRLLLEHGRRRAKQRPEEAGNLDRGRDHVPACPPQDRRRLVHDLHARVRVRVRVCVRGTICTDVEPSRISVSCLAYSCLESYEHPM